MTEREPAPQGGDDGGDSGGAPSGETDETIYTPTDLGDYEIREGEYGPLERRSRDVEGE